jgi:hypothetical protein
VTDIPEVCPICFGQLTWKHDHRSDNTGLDDGPPLVAPRKKPEAKSGDEMKRIRAQAWKTRRQKYGAPGHR